MSWKRLVKQTLEDYSSLALMGIIVGLISWIVDKGIHVLDDTRILLYEEVTDVLILQYLGWMSMSVAVLLFAAGFVHIVEPKAAGSGIPEMKTILRGVNLKGYLSFRILVAKVVGVIATLGSGMPLGKEGPFVHIGGIVASLVTNVFDAFKKNHDRGRNIDMLAAGTAVGISACFAAPIGGMLFSIEVTSTYFAVRHYWKRYFAALWGGIMFRLLAVWSNKEQTIKPLFATNFPDDFPYSPIELVFFALLGVICGLLGALFVYMHRKYMYWVKHNPVVKRVLGYSPFIYPGVCAFVIATLSFPRGFGKYMAGAVTTHQQMTDLLNDITWSKDNLTVIEVEALRHWIPEGTNVFVNIFCYFVFHFIFSMIAYTLPVPCGAFVPSLKIGCGFGRLFGEVLHTIFPLGIIAGVNIVPGAYALVGAAAFSAALTRSIAVAVIVLEVTGQLTHLIPLLLAVLMAYSVVSLLQPSLYDSIIVQKKLPYLPDLRSSAAGMYSLYVENFANKNVAFIWNGLSYGELTDILNAHKTLKTFPLVDHPQNMILLGSVKRDELIKALDRHIGETRRLQVALAQRMDKQRRIIKEKAKYQPRRKSSSEGVLPEPDVTLAQTANGDGAKRFALRELVRQHSSYSTESSSRFRDTISSIFGRNMMENDLLRDLEIGMTLSTSDPVLLQKKIKFIKSRVDLTPSDREAWEHELLKEPVNFSDVIVNAAPVQLVDKTPLAEVHSLFSMVGISHAYVTNIGKLVGVVGLTEISKAIADVNAGDYDPYPTPASPASSETALGDETSAATHLLDSLNGDTTTTDHSRDSETSDYTADTDSIRHRRDSGTND